LDLKLFANITFLIVLLLASLGAFFGYACVVRKWIFVSKPLMITVLILFYLVNAYQDYPIVVIALMLAFLGDIFLMWQNNLPFFIPGFLNT
jgi:hypothetical protein